MHRKSRRGSGPLETGLKLSAIFDPQQNLASKNLFKVKMMLKMWDYFGFLDGFKRLGVSL